MRHFLLLASLLAFGQVSQAKDPPLIEKYLHSGELAQGEQALILAFEKNPKDDEARFGLGILQFTRAVERFGQSLYEYGAKSENTAMPFLRLPVPKNETPSKISYKAFGRVLDAFIADLERAEKTLAGVTDENVKLPIRLAGVKFNLTGSFIPNDKFLDILVKLNGGRFAFLNNNKEFLVCFDRGDVAWLRAYCHLLSAMLEAYRSVDLEAHFDERVKDVFPNVEASTVGKPDKDSLVISDGPRLGRFRKHMVAVCELNRETWKYIRAEKDDDHEWLPHPKQKGVLGIPMTEDMIDVWLEMMGQLEDLLKGERLFPGEFLAFGNINTNGKGVNVKTLFDDPPKNLSEAKMREDGIDAKYLQGKAKKDVFDIGVLLRVSRIFDNPMGLAYMAWLN